MKDAKAVIASAGHSLREFWTDPSPIFKQLTTVGAFLVAILIVVFVPGFGVVHIDAFVYGVAVVVGATMLAAIVSIQRSYWRLEGIPWALDFIAIGLLQLATNSSLSPITLLPVLVVLLFAGMEGNRKFIGYSALGSIVALVVPVIVGQESTESLWVAIFGVVVMTNVAWFVHEVTSSQRQGLVKQRELSAATEDLLQASLAHTRELEQSKSERSAAERMLRGVWLAVTEQAIIATDVRGVIAAWNPGAEKLLGYRAEEVVDARGITELLAPDQASELDTAAVVSSPENALTALVGSGTERSTAEWNLLLHDGSSVPVQLSSTPRFDELGAQIGYLFVANDISEAREVAKLKDEFVGLISHELRTPLSSIIGYLELLRDEDEDPLTESQLQYLGIAERNAHRLLHLVGDLLFAAQVEAGSFRLDETEVDLAEILDASLATARPIADNAGVRLVRDVSGSNAIRVTGDPVRLGQAIDNLVSNAVKFTPRGGTVTLSLDIEGDSVVLSVRDTGLGIAASELDQLFSRFFRATTATANAVPGVGLGLTITKAIVTAHHGEMGVESEEGVGTCFRVTLPLASMPVEAQI